MESGKKFHDKMKNLSILSVNLLIVVFVEAGNWLRDLKNNFKEL